MESSIQYSNLARVEPNYSDYLIFEGISVDEHTGEQKYLDATVAYRRACLNAVEYLKKFGYTGEQAYMILGTAPVEGRISGIVDIPNACCTLAIPTEIFDFDIRPNANGPKRKWSLAPMRQFVVDRNSRHNAGIVNSAVVT